MYLCARAYTRVYARNELTKKYLYVKFLKKEIKRKIIKKKGITKVIPQKERKKEKKKKSFWQTGNLGKFFFTFREKPDSYFRKLQKT